MSKKTAIFPGSFDPFTIGHESVITRALPLFDVIIVAIGTNTTKKAYFSIEQRMKMIREVFRKQDTLTVAEVRDLFKASRKYALALMEYLDACGITRREGDVRRLTG